MKKTTVYSQISDFLENYIDEPNFPKEAYNYLKSWSKLKGKYVWDNKKIHAAINKFIDKNGRPPFAKELDLNKELPSHIVISTTYDMTAGQWLKTYYPQQTQDIKFFHTYKYISKEDVGKLFVDEYNRIKPKSAVQYNKERNINAPSWEYVGRTYNIRTWSELKKYFFLITYKKEKEELHFSVNSRIM